MSKSPSQQKTTDMGVIGIAFAGFVGAIVALISPLVAVWVGLFLWGGASPKRIGLAILAIGYTSGALSGSAIRLGFLAVTGQQP